MENYWADEKRFDREVQGFLFCIALEIIPSFLRLDLQRARICSCEQMKHQFPRLRLLKLDNFPRAELPFAVVRKA